MIEHPSSRGSRPVRALSRRGDQLGFTLIEVLVTMVLLAIGLLGVAALQAVSLKNSHGSFYRSIASQQASDMADRVAANLAGVNAGQYDNLTATLPTDPKCFTTGCTAAAMAVTDQYQWLRANAVMLPGGTGTVRCVRGPAATCTVNAPNSNRVFDITVAWTERTETGTTVQSFVTQSAP